ncbi:MAG: hypothetical protein WBB45_07605 [Cyclobacteriaceae bacterium]
MKEQQVWYDSLKEKYERNYWARQNGLSKNSGFKLLHWGHTKIIELCLKHDHIARQYFPELFPFGTGKFKLSEADIDSKLTNWLPSEHGKNRYYQYPVRDAGEYTTDPVFDFHFKNSTKEIHLLHRIEIHIEKVWTKIKGIPQNQFLKSLGTIEYTPNFDEPINTISFDDPMIFPSGQPIRFHIQLNDFANRCPGNMAELKFWFYFDEIVIPTDTFTLSF